MPLMRESLDALGLLCPLPVLKLRKRLKSMPSGAEIDVLTDDPAAIIDIPHFCQESRHIVVSAEPIDAGYRWVIRKT